MQPPVARRARRLEQPRGRRRPRRAHAPFGRGDPLRRLGHGRDDGGHAVGDALEPSRRGEGGHVGARAVAPAAQAREQRAQRRARPAARGQQPSLEQRGVHLELARLAGRAPQPAGRAAGAPRLAGPGPAVRRPPHVQRDLEPAGGDAQVVHGLGVASAAHAHRGGRQGGAAQEQLEAGAADRGRATARPLVRRPRHHAAGAGRPLASSAATLSHSSSEMSSTFRVASIVVNAYSCDRSSSSRMMRRW